MSTKNSPAKYSEDFKKTIVTLYQSGKTYAEIRKEYGVLSTPNRKNPKTPARK